MGHLLNQELGGTGKELKNLTPLFGTDNTNHFYQIEKRLQELKAAALLNPDVVVLYTVIPTYGRTVNQTTIDEAQRLKHPHAATIAQIVQAEQYVPLNLVTKLRVWKAPAPATITEQLDKTIANNITQGVNDYQLDRLLTVMPKASMKRGLPLHTTSAAALEKAGLWPAEARAFFQAAQLANQAAFGGAQDVVAKTNGQVDLTRLQDLLNNGRVSL